MPFSSNGRPYRKKVPRTTLKMISIDYPQRFAGRVRRRGELAKGGAAKHSFLLLRDSNGLGPFCIEGFLVKSNVKREV